MRRLSRDICTIMPTKCSSRSPVRAAKSWIETPPSCTSMICLSSDCCSAVLLDRPSKPPPSSETASRNNPNPWCSSRLAWPSSSTSAPRTSSSASRSGPAWLVAADASGASGRCRDSTIHTTVSATTSRGASQTGCHSSDSSKARALAVPPSRGRLAKSGEMETMMTYPGSAAHGAGERLTRERQQARGDVVQCLHLAGGAELPGGAGHAPDHRAVLVLHQRGGASLAQLQQAARAVVPHAGQQNGDGGGAGAGSHRAEQHVDAGLVPVDRRAVVQAADVLRAIPHHQQVVAAWGDVGMAGLDRLAIARLAYTHGRTAVHALGKRAAEGGRNMLGHQDRRGIGRHRLQHHPHRLGTAGGRADGDDRTVAADTRAMPARQYRIGGQPRRHVQLAYHRARARLGARGHLHALSFLKKTFAREKILKVIK